MHGDFADVVGKKPVLLLFATPQLCQSRVCGPVVDVALQLRARYGDEVEFIHQEVYTDNDPKKGLREPLQEFNLPTEPWLFAVGKDGQDHRAARGLVRPRRDRAGAQDRVVTRRSRLAVVAGGAAAAVALAPHGRPGARDRPAHVAADPGGRVRVGGGDRDGGLVRRARAAVAAPAAAGAALATAARRARARARGPGGRGALRRASASRCSSLVVLAGYEGGGSALDNLAPTFILIDFWVGLAFASVLFGDVFRAFSPWRAIRLPGIRPYPERWGRYPAALALLGFTWIELVSGWGEAPGDLTTAAVGYTVYTLAMQAVFGTEAWTAQRRGASRSTSTSSRAFGVGDARPRRRPAAAAGRAAAARRRCPAPCCSSS